MPTIQSGNVSVNNGDMNTADANSQGTIVGNSRSMIYHVPGQRGYRMNSENAVYFNTEAQAAGYRRAKVQISTVAIISLLLWRFFI